MEIYNWTQIIDVKGKQLYLDDKEARRDSKKFIKSNIEKAMQTLEKLSSEGKTVPARLEIYLGPGPLNSDIEIENGILKSIPSDLAYGSNGITYQYREKAIFYSNIMSKKIEVYQDALSELKRDIKLIKHVANHPDKIDAKLDNSDLAKNDSIIEVISNNNLYHSFHLYMR